MKQFVRTLFAAGIAAMAFVSCAQNELTPDVVEGKKVTVHFGTENTDPTSTKATLTPIEGETAFQAAWEVNDEISISYSFNYADPSITTGKWTGSSFEATIPAGNGDWMYDAAYPVPDAKDSHVDFGSTRTQKGNAYNSKYDIMIGTAAAGNAYAGKDEAGKDIVFKMDRQTAIAYFHFTSDLDEAVTKATLTVAGKGAFIASNYAYVSGYAWSATEDCTSITLTFPEEAPSAKDFQLWFNVLPTIYDSMSLTVETTSKTFTISKNTGKLCMYEAGKLYKVKKSEISWTDKGGSTTPSTVTDVITADKLEATGSSYADFSGVKISSNAVYAGNNAKTSEGAIQLRSTNSNSGIVTTTSGGKATKVSVEWASKTTSGRVINVYGNTNPYTAASDLYSTGDNSNQGTKIGTIVCGTSTELIIDGDYPYIGIRSNSGALYLDSVSITWESGSSEPAPDTYSVSCATVTGGTLSASPVKAKAGAEVTLTATPDKGYDFKNDWIVTNAETSEVITVTGGKFAMPAANVNVTASFKQLSYAITANPAENGTYTVKVGEEEVTSAVYGAKVLLEATPASGYICDGWTVVDAESKSVYVSNNSFTMPASEVTISTTFSLKPEDITYDHAGTAEDPYSVADVLKYISTLGTATSTEDVYVKGIISSISEVSTSYGNATYFIKDEGIENEVKVFRGLYLDGAKFTSADQIGVGDEVVVVGKVLDYNGTPEVNSGNKIVSILKVTASKETGIAAKGETITITVDTNVDSWSATSDNAAFVVGTPSGNTVDVSIAENTGKERTANITITAGTLSKTITLTQKAAGSPDEKPEEIVLANGTYSGSGTAGIITWSGTSCSFVQTKEDSNTSVNSSYVSAPRWYAGHKVTFTANTGYTLTKVVVECTKTEYATALNKSTYSVGASASVSGSTVTITTSGDFSVTMGAQSRISSVTVYYTE